MPLFQFQSTCLTTPAASPLSIGDGTLSLDAAVANACVVRRSRTALRSAAASAARAQMSGRPPAPTAPPRCQARSAAPPLFSAALSHAWVRSPALAERDDGGPLECHFRCWPHRAAEVEAAANERQRHRQHHHGACVCACSGSIPPSFGSSPNAVTYSSGAERWNQKLTAGVPVRMRSGVSLRSLWARSYTRRSAACSRGCQAPRGAAQRWRIYPSLRVRPLGPSPLSPSRYVPKIGR